MRKKGGAHQPISNQIRNIFILLNQVELGGEDEKIPTVGNLRTMWRDYWKLNDVVHTLSKDDLLMVYMEQTLKTLESIKPKYHNSFPLDKLITTISGNISDANKIITELLTPRGSTRARTRPDTGPTISVGLSRTVSGAASRAAMPWRIENPDLNDSLPATPVTTPVSGSTTQIPNCITNGHTDWEQDEVRDSCYICNQAFTFFRRKHHCRFCGKLVCYNCSQEKRNCKKGSEDPSTPQIICTNCI